jgi:hypothetical protein
LTTVHPSNPRSFDVAFQSAVISAVERFVYVILTDLLTRPEAVDGACLFNAHLPVSLKKSISIQLESGGEFV